MVVRAGQPLVFLSVAGQYPMGEIGSVIISLTSSHFFTKLFILKLYHFTCLQHAISIYKVGKILANSTDLNKYKEVDGGLEVVKEKPCLWFTTNPAPKNSGLYSEYLQTSPNTDKRRVRFECEVPETVVERWESLGKKYMTAYWYEFFLTEEENPEWYISLKHYPIQFVYNVHVDGQLVEDPKNELVGL